MDKALHVLDLSNKLMFQTIWKPRTYFLCLKHDMLLPPPETINIKRLKLDSHTINHILPFLDGETFDQFMTDIGAFLWKKSEEEHLMLEDAKLLLTMVIQRPTLECLFMAYLTEWESDQKHFPDHLYSIGLGRLLRFSHLALLPKVMFFKQMSSNLYVKIAPILPLLKHIHCYSFSQDEFQPTTDHTVRVPMTTPANTIEYENLFFYKLTFVAVRISQHRWCEAWAQAMSALDVYQKTMECQHNLLCFIALLAGTNHLSDVSVFRALEEAQKANCMMEHDWQRILTFQQICIEKGFFELESEVYNFGYNFIPHMTDYCFTLMRQHLESLMRQSEDILMFANIRYCFHSFCQNEFKCQVPLLINHSYIAVEKLVQEMEKIVPKLFMFGEKEFYKGIIELYRASKPNPEMTHEELLQKQLGIKFLTLAQKRLKQSDFRSVQVAKLMRVLENPNYDLDSIFKLMENVTLNKWSPDGANMAFQIAIILSHSKMGGKRHMKHLKMFYQRATHNTGYRQPLINAALRFTEEQDLFHTLHPEISDYPNVEDCFSREDKCGDVARFYWFRDKDTIEKKLLDMLQTFKTTTMSTCASDKTKPSTLQSVPTLASKQESVSLLNGDDDQEWREENESEEEENDEVDSNADTIIDESLQNVGQNETRENDDVDSNADTIILGENETGHSDDEQQEEEEDEDDKEEEEEEEGEGEEEGEVKNTDTPPVIAFRLNGEVNLSAGSPLAKRRCLTKNDTNSGNYNSKNILELDTKAQEVYAFGLFLTHKSAL